MQELNTSPSTETLLQSSQETGESLKYPLRRVSISSFGLSEIWHRIPFSKHSLSIC